MNEQQQKERRTRESKEQNAKTTSFNFFFPLITSAFRYPPKKMTCFLTAAFLLQSSCVSLLFSFSFSLLFSLSLSLSLSLFVCLSICGWFYGDGQRNKTKQRNAIVSASSDQSEKRSILSVGWFVRSLTSSSYEESTSFIFIHFHSFSFIFIHFHFNTFQIIMKYIIVLFDMFR